MRKIEWRVFCLVGIFFFTSMTIFADESPIKPIRTVTLWVKKYGELETQLNEAIVNHNINKIQPLLSDDFEERKSDNPNSPIPKEEWMKVKMKLASKNPPQIQQMAVRTINNVYIVSYLSTIKDTSKPAFIVDVWKANGAESQLMVRYSS
jgi:hypothetical protein